MRAFVDELQRAGELDIVDRAVDPRYELAAVTRAAQRRSARALLFSNVRGTGMPVVTNLYSGRRRLAGLIGADEDDFCRRWNAHVDAAARRTAPATEPMTPAPLLRAGRLRDLPLIHYHGRDAGAYFTSAVYLARDPDTGVANLSFHRSLVVDDGELRVRLGSTHDLAACQRRAEQAGEPLPAALLIGVNPAVFLAAAARIPAQADELALAAEIAGAPIPTRRCASIDLEVPADTEIVVEGRFLPGIRRREGPFGEFMGYYVSAGDNHVFEISAVHWLAEPLFHSVVCGSAEDLSVLEARTAAGVYRHLSAVLPGIIDVSCAPALLNTTVKIRKQYEGHGRQVLLAAFGTDLDYNKLCIVVDEDVDITDLNEVLWAYVTRGRADTRVMVVNDVPGFYRDEHRDHWGRLGIDATRPFGREAEFERKSIPGEDDVDLDAYLRPRV
ncbi:MAG: UbiD family decarboxylase [Gammaproteobacteria bacterium]|nr:UbiD family decarboxylase [Gammaproteobacteria bacterium]